MQNNFHNPNTDLPIIHKLIEAYKLWQEFLPNFPKTSRYSLGSKIDEAFLETIKFTFKACHLRETQKLSAVEDASAELDLLKFFLRIAWEIRALDNKKYTAISVLLDEIGRMIGGWAKQVKLKLSEK